MAPLVRLWPLRDDYGELRSRLWCLRHDLNMRNYKNIKAWVEADNLTVMVYETSRSFPKEEVYGLTSQLRRAAYSVPANIAEGAGRNSNKDYLRFLHMARDSLNETEYFIHLAIRLGYLQETDAPALEPQLKSTFVRLHGLIKAVAKEV